MRDRIEMEEVFNTEELSRRNGQDRAQGRMRCSGSSKNAASREIGANKMSTFNSKQYSGLFRKAAKRKREAIGVKENV